MKGARVFQCPTKYIQHPGLIKHIGPVVSSTYPSLSRAGVIISKRARQSDYGKQLIASFSDPLIILYDQECTRAHVSTVAEQAASANVDHVVAFGGGKVSRML